MAARSRGSRVGEPAGRVQGQGLGAPEAAHVRRQHMMGAGQLGEVLDEEPTGGQVAVQQHQGWGLWVTGLQRVYPQALGVDEP